MYVCVTCMIADRDVSSFVSCDFHFGSSILAVDMGLAGWVGWLVGCIGSRVLCVSLKSSFFTIDT